jgi:hypothetical protein
MADKSRFSDAKVGGRPRPGAIRDALAQGAGHLLRRIGLPAQMRFLPQALLGQRTFTAADLLPWELADLQEAVERSQTRIAQERAGRKRPRQGVQYADYPQGSNNLRTLAALLPNSALPLSLGRANYAIDPATGETDVTDTYDFLNNARKADIEKYQAALASGGRLGQFREFLRQAQDYTPQRFLTTGLPQELGELLLPEGPDVRIRLPRPVTPPSKVRRAILAN